MMPDIILIDLWQLSWLMGVNAGQKYNKWPFKDPICTVASDKKIFYIFHHIFYLNNGGPLGIVQGYPTKLGKKAIQGPLLQSLLLVGWKLAEENIFLIDDRTTDGRQTTDTFDGINWLGLLGQVNLYFKYKRNRHL